MLMIWEGDSVTELTADRFQRAKELVRPCCTAEGKHAAPSEASRRVRVGTERSSYDG